jgi:hypothetical protein
MLGLALTTVILEVLEDRQGAAEHGLALSEADGGMARLGQMAAADAEKGGFAAAVARLLAGGQGVLLDRVQRRPVASQHEEAGQTADQLPGRLLQSGGGGRLDGGHQVGPFQLEPGQRVGQQPLDQRSREQPAGRAPEADHIGGDGQARIGLLGQGQPAGGHPRHRHPPLVLAVLGRRAFPGVQPDQVVEPVAAGPGRVDGGQVQQLGVGQPLHQRLRLVMGDPSSGPASQAEKSPTSNRASSRSARCWVPLSAW